jgi:hypothetical protein
MGKDNKKVTNTTSTTTKPENTSVETTEYFVFDDKGNKVFTPNYQRKVTQERVVGPDAQTLGLFNEHIAPTIAKKHGVTVNEKGEVVLDTPLSKFMGYDVEAERKRREKVKELNEFRRKEANWYNGISVLMDIAGAAAGARVQKRTPTDVAAQAVAANEALRREGMAEDAAIEQVKQKKAYDYWSDMAKQISELNSKVREEYTEKPQSQKTKHTSEVKSTTTSTSTTTGGSSKGDSGGGGSARYLGYTVMVNGKPENREIPMDIGTYNKIGEDIISHYRKLYQDADSTQKKAIAAVLEGMGVRVKTKGGYEWRKDAAMSQGLFYMLPEELKKEIIKKANGEIEFVEGENGMDVIQPKGAARPFIPTPEGDEEEEELMGS